MIAAVTVIEIFEAVANDYANYTEKFRFNPKTGDYDVVFRYQPDDGGV